MTDNRLYESTLKAVRKCKPYAAGRLDEYLSAFAGSLEQYAVTEFEGEIDDAIVASIEAVLPARNEFIDVITAAARFDPDGRWIIRLQRFFERIIPYMHPAPDRREVPKLAYDNYKFIVHELFLYTIAALLMFDRFEQADHLFAERYYTAQGSVHGVMLRFDEFHKHIGSLEDRNDRLGTGSESPRADLLRERCTGTEVSFNALMQADFTIFLRAELEYYPHYSSWWPELLMFLDEFGGAFEVFIRARSEEHFDRLRIALGIMNPDDLQELITAYEDESRRMPRGMKPQSMAQLVGYQFLSTTKSG